MDLLDDPLRGGGWEEVWRSLQMVEHFDIDEVIGHMESLGSAITAAHVGLFLEENGERLMVEEAHLDALRKLVPIQPRYMDTRRQPGKLVSRWNLIVPRRVLTQEWAEVS